MGWFHFLNGHDPHDDQSDRLQRAEEEEHEATRRVVDAGVRAAMRADESGEHARELRERIERARNGSDGDAVILTAESVLRLLREREKRP